MGNRWKPEYEETYWIVDTKYNPAVMPVKWVGCRYGHNQYCNGNFFKTREEAIAAAEKVRALLLGLHEPATGCDQLSKLTVEVFDRPDCPEWAKYAAVNPSGYVVIFSAKPKNTHTGWRVTFNNTDVQADVLDCGKFDASDWQNSLVERPSEDLPKLTSAVFNRTDCPEWAKYAALGGRGVLTFYEDKPMMSKDEYPKRWINYDRWYTVEGIKFDASDWQNSLIERPSEVLPKLTTDVFNQPDCPKWAKWAAVDKCGKVRVHAEKPYLPTKFECEWWCSDDNDSFIDGYFDSSDWKNSLIKRPSKDLPKLTSEVFDHEDCPKWALYAAVDKSGHAYWYASLPKHEIYSLTHQCVWHNESKNFKMIPGKFDASDWQNSLIERPAEDLPDWCKVDAICWHKRCGYFKVTYIDDVSRRVVIQQVEDNSKGYLSFHTVCNEVTQADRRPYNNYEMASLVGKVLKNENGSVHWLVHTYLDDGSILVGNDNKYYADGIMGCSVDGVRTCHLKHLNEKGEWVE